mgnify:CR=1 FL=1
MVKNHTQKTGALKPFEFHEFVQYFPHAALKAGISRNAFVSVSVMLARHGTFKTGESIYPSVVTLADEAGVSRPTARKVLAYLQQIGVLEPVGQQRNPGGGSPVTKYRLRRNELVDVVIATKDRNYGSGKPRTTVVSPVETSEPLSGNLSTTEWKAQNHNKNNQSNQNASSEKSSSSAPIVAEPSARSGAEEKQVDWIDQLLSEIGTLPLDGI